MTIQDVINNQILWPVLTLILGVVGKIVYDWARRGASTCEHHYKIIVTVQELTDQLKTLVAEQQKLTAKLDKVTDQVIDLKTDVALISCRSHPS